MLNNLPVHLGFILIIIGLSVSAYSQKSVSSIPEIELLYKELKYEKALAKGKELLQTPENLSLNDLATVHKYLGVIYFSIGASDSSRSHFLSYINLKPGGTLDPINFSPKIIEFFENIRDSNQSEYGKVKSEPFTQYVFIEDRRPGAAWRSALLPGWGQMYKNQRSRGIIVSSAFLGSAIITATAFYFEENYHQDYLNSQSQSDIEKNYDKYNNWYKVRRSFTWITASIWLLNLADAIWTPYSKAEISVSPLSPTPLALKLYIN
jgi:hypothetical protein